MNKRAFLEGFFTASTVAFGGQFMWKRVSQQSSLITTPRPTVAQQTATPATYELTPIEFEATQPAQGLPAPAPVAELASSKDSIEIESFSDQQVDSYLRKIRNFDAVFASDIYLDPRYETLLLKTAAHMNRVEAYIGHGNFNLMSFDELLSNGRNFPAIGKFEADELNFLEEIFFANPHRHGFFGKKISREITDFIPRQEVAKIDDTGHFLLRGESLNLYEQIKKDVGNEIILTSGVRSNVKQMHLFLAKSIEANGNLSRASRSLAPPGHSYHGVGDFDIGKIGLGERNFTTDFSTTEEYQKIAGLGYVDIRYPTDNLFGVRFEPWHIKMS